MKKISVLYHSVGLWVVPMVLVCAFTAVTSFATSKYEYLPEALDFMIGLFHYASVYVLEISLFFCIGAFSYALYKKNAISAVCCAAIAFFHAGLLPMVTFLVRSFFIANISSAETMEEYWTMEVYTSMANFSRVMSFLVIAGIVALICGLTKYNAPFEKPYVIPKSQPAIASAAMCALYVIYSLILFVLDGEYDFAVIAYQVIFALAGYFAVILGSYAHHKILYQTDLDIVNKK